MRKIITLILFILNFFSFAGNSHLPQDTLQIPKSGWREGNCILSFGYGFPNYSYMVISNYVSEEVKLSSIYKSIPIHAKIEFSAFNQLGIGASVSYNNVSFLMKEINKPAYNAKFTVLTVNTRLNYHFLYRKTFDPYIGIGIGIKESRLHLPRDLMVTKNTIGFECTIGVRYLAFGVLGMYLEAGLGRSFIQGGLSFNLFGFKKR